MRLVGMEGPDFAAIPRVRLERVESSGPRQLNTMNHLEPAPPEDIERYRATNTITVDGREYEQCNGVLHTVRACPNLEKANGVKTFPPGEPNPQESYDKERYREQFGEEFPVKECELCRRRRTDD